MSNANMVSPIDDVPLSCSGISKRFATQVVLDRVTLAVAPGTVLGLIGRNGAGKTTLLRILLGLMLADSGTTAVFGAPAKALTDASKARLCYVPQQPDALSWLRVGDMLEFIGACYPRWDHAFVRYALDRWQVDTSKVFARLSPGERQRVALIRALAARPELLVLDEPAATLDPVARRELLREIAARAGDAGTTVVFSSHIVSDLERVASHVAFLHGGRLLVHAAMDDLAETHVRVRIPAAAGAAQIGRVAGEIGRRSHADGSLSLLLTRQVGDAWPAVVALPGATTESLGLEDLFIEVAE